MSSADASLLLYAASRSVTSKWPDVASKLADRIAEHLRSGEASPRDAANSLDALGRMRCRHQGLLEGAAGYVPSRVVNFAPQDAVGIAVALGRLQEADEPTLLALAGQLCRDMHRLKPGQLAAAVTAFARLRVREVRFMQKLLETCALPAVRDALRPDEAVALLSAFGRLRAAHAGALEAAGDAVLSSCLGTDGVLRPATAPGLRPSDLQEVAVAFARARWAHKTALDAVADACADPEYCPRFEVAGTVLYALSLLRWQHAPLQRAVLEAVLGADEAGPPLLAKVLHASVSLDTASSVAGRELWLRACLAAARCLQGISTGGATKAHNSVAHVAEGDDHEPDEDGYDAHATAHNSSFGAFAIATGRRSVSDESRGLLAHALAACLGNPPWTTSQTLLHALVLQADGALSRPAMAPLRQPLLEAVGDDGRQDFRSAAVSSNSGASWLEALHEGGLRGRMPPKEARDVCKKLIRPAALGVSILLTPRWCPGGDRTNLQLDSASP